MQDRANVDRMVRDRNLVDRMVRTGDVDKKSQSNANLLAATQQAQQIVNQTRPQQAPQPKKD